MTARVRLPMEALLEASGDPDEPDRLGELRAALIIVLQETALNPQSRTVFDIIFLNVNSSRRTSDLRPAAEGIF